VLKRPRILIFDEATSGLDQQTAERFAGTVNRLKGVATVVFIAHQLPKGLAVDGVEALRDERTATMRVVEDSAQ
jgi:subfamily B ATP-binding cassette protein HlyB/CyaB